MKQLYVTFQSSLTSTTVSRHCLTVLSRFAVAFPDREMAAQVLDSMDLNVSAVSPSRRRASPWDYKATDGETYQLNFIDTPYHVDFSYEVSRLLAACEGALLVVDAGRMSKPRRWLTAILGDGNGP